MPYIRRKTPRTYRWTIRIDEPDNDGFETTEMVGIFRQLTRGEIDEALKGGGDEALLLKAMVGWEGLEDEDKKPIPFSEEELKAQCQEIPWFRAAVRAYLESATKAPEGN